MKTSTLSMVQWPYSFVIEQSANGILLRPKRKARVGWGKAFKKGKKTEDLAELRSVRNQFDSKEWVW